MESGGFIGRLAGGYLTDLVVKRNKNSKQVAHVVFSNDKQQIIIHVCETDLKNKRLHYELPNTYTTPASLFKMGGVDNFLFC